MTIKSKLSALTTTVTFCVGLGVTLVLTPALDLASALALAMALDPALASASAFALVLAWHLDVFFRGGQKMETTGIA